jgi:hypothetical protein
MTHTLKRQVHLEGQPLQLLQILGQAAQIYRNHKLFIQNEKDTSNEMQEMM